MINIVFFGTPQFAVNFLSSLHADADICVKAVVCQPDKPVGRKKILTPPETKIYALTTPTPSLEKEGRSIKILQPNTLRNNDVVNELKNLNADIFVVVAYGKIIPNAILNIPKYGCVNVHPSLLPKYRGPSPIQSVILNQEQETGVSVMLLDHKMDHGPILAQSVIKVSNDETPDTLREKVIKIGAPLLLSTIKNLIAGSIKPVPQDGSEATTCKLLTRDDGRIDWMQSANQIDSQIRALTPWPGTYTTWNGKTIKIIKSAISDKQFDCGEVNLKGKDMFVGTNSFALKILELQEEGGSKMSADKFVNGHQDIDQATFL